MGVPWHGEFYVSMRPKGGNVSLWNEEKRFHSLYFRDARASYLQINVHYFR